MRRLRDPRDGCAWDRQQSFSSIAPSTLEEAYEVVDAIERDDLSELKSELGDLLFQVVFHAQIASEQEAFDFNDVAAAIAEKLLRRHPHLFAAADKPTLEQQSAQWENIKAQERQAAGNGDRSHLAGVPRALPALARAAKLSKRAARVGFDWDQPEQTAEKVAEELEEVLQALRAGGGGPKPSANLFEEIGDLLFAVANLARKVNVDAESALRAANSKFERRFRHMERSVLASGDIFERLPLDALEKLWVAAKRAELNGG